MLNKILQILNKEQKSKIYIIIILSIILMLLETATLSSIYPLSQLIFNENYIYEVKNFLKIEYLNNSLIFILIIILIMIIFLSKVFFSIFVYNFHYSTIYKIQNQTTEKLFLKYSAQNLDFHILRDSSTLIRNLTSEINQYTLAILSLTVLIQEGLIVIGLTALMMIVNLKLFFILFSFIIVNFIIYFFFLKKKLEIWGLKRQRSEGGRIQYIKEYLQNFKELKIYNLEIFFLNKLKKINIEYADSLKKIKILQKIPNLIIEFSFFSLLILFIYFKIGEINLNLLTSISIFILSAIRIISPLNRCIQSIQHLRYCKEVVDLLDKDLKIEDDNDINKIDLSDIVKAKNISIKIHNLSFTRNTKNILKNLNYEFQINNIIGIKGKSGSGKTTLANIIAGLTKPTKGSITCNEKNIFHDIKNWHKLISYVSQETFIFNDTLKKNLIFNNISNDKEIIELLKHFNLQNLLTRFNGINDQLGETGLKISGGERQRISLVRAFLKKPKIIILDEATSALDNKNTQIVMNYLVANKSKFITFIISHDTNLFTICDQLVYTDQND